MSIITQLGGLKHVKLNPTKFFLLLFVLLIIKTYIVHFCFNYLMPRLFNIREISFYEALILTILFSVLI